MIASVVLGLAAARDADAFSAQGRAWANRAGDPVIFRLHPDGSDDVADGSDLEAIRRAFVSWDNVACSYLEFVEGPWVEPRRVANDQTNRIFFAELEGEWVADQAGTLALTYTFYRVEDNTITDADIFVNGVNWRFTTTDGEIGQGTPAKVDLETVMFHEIGHFFGLDHSNDTTAAMFPSNNKPMQRGPALDDVQGICSLYSNGQPVPNPGSPTPNGAAVGSPCQASTDCASNRCVLDETINRTYCTALCDLANPAAACPTGYDCTPTQSGNYCLAPATVDELCDPCDQGSQCASGFCTAVPGVNANRGFCTRPCDPTPGQPQQCPDGYSCQGVLGAAGGACAPNSGVCNPVGRGGQNEPCYVNGQCKPGYTCVEYYQGSGLNFCYYACSAQSYLQSCTQGGGTRCDTVTSRDNAFACFSIANVGEPCIPEICDPTSFCAYDESAGVDSAICYRMCNSAADCGAQAQCQAFPGLPNLCIPLMGFKYEGESCTTDAECRSATCRTYGNNRLCTATCATTDANGCGRGLKCIPQVGSTNGLCWPEAYTPTNMEDPTRNITDPPPGFCACDYSTACDPDCDCDPECTTSCGCTTAERAEAPATPASAATPALLAALALVTAVLRRRR